MTNDITPLADDEIAALWIAAYPDEYPDTDPTAPYALAQAGHAHYIAPPQGYPPAQELAP